MRMVLTHAGFIVLAQRRCLTAAVVILDSSQMSKSNKKNRLVIKLYNLNIQIYAFLKYLFWVGETQKCVTELYETWKD